MPFSWGEGWSIAKQEDVKATNHADKKQSLAVLKDNHLHTTFPTPLAANGSEFTTELWEVGMWRPNSWICLFIWRPPQNAASSKCAWSVSKYLMQGHFPELSLACRAKQNILGLFGTNRVLEQLKRHPRIYFSNTHKRHKALKDIYVCLYRRICFVIWTCIKVFI